MPVFNREMLCKVGSAIFEKLGATHEEAEMVADSLALANLMGHDSHGAIRIPQYAGLIRDGLIQPKAEIEIETDTPALTVLNGNWGFGQVIAREAVRIAMEKAKKAGISCAGAHNVNHTGRVGEYVEGVARQNMIGLASVNNHGAGQVMAPYGGTERRMSPNPLAIAFPSGKNDPVLLDMTCSVVAEGKVRVKRNRGESIPEGWITDGQGQPSTDPNDYYAEPFGAILPFGGIVGHKGGGLAFALDVLCGTLSRAGCSRRGATRLGNGFFTIVIDLEQFMKLDDFVAEVQQLTEYVKSSALAPGFTEILIPGEPEFRERARREKEGVFIDDETWRQIVECGKEAGIDVSHFPV